MFTLAQYVFGIGKSEEDGQQTLNDQSVGLNPPHSPQASCEDVNNSHCVQTNIEDDWILVEVGDENSNIKTRVKSKSTRSTKQHSTTNNNKKNKGSSTKAKSKSSKTTQEKWVVDPPECFKPVDTKKKCSLKPAEEPTPAAVDDSKENLLIEFPSTTVFESLFVKRSDSESTTEPSQVIVSSTVEKIPSTDALSVDLVLVSAQNCPSTPAVSPTFVASSKKARSKNSPKSRKALETLNQSAAVNAAISQNKAIVAVVASGESKKRKRSITRKQHDRQNRTTVQRNGPIIRGKKMFAQINGAYQCNRAHC